MSNSSNLIYTVSTPPVSYSCLVVERFSLSIVPCFCHAVTIADEILCWHICLFFSAQAVSTIFEFVPPNVKLIHLAGFTFNVNILRTMDIESHHFRTRRLLYI